MKLKRLYFNIYNGEVVEPSEYLPSNRVLVHKGKIHEIEACYNMSNIASKGYDWFSDSATKENKSWNHDHPHLMTSLKKFIRKYRFKKQEEKNEQFYRFVFVPVWRKED